MNRIVGRPAIHRLIDEADTVSRSIERVVDRASADRVVPRSRRLKGPAKARVAAASWFLFGCEPLRGAEVHAAEDELAGAERQEGRDRGVEGARGDSGCKAADSRPCEEDEPCSACGHREANERRDADVPVAWQEPGRQEVPVEPALIGDEGADDAARRQSR